MNKKTVLTISLLLACSILFALGMNEGPSSYPVRITDIVEHGEMSTYSARTADGELITLITGEDSGLHITTPVKAGDYLEVSTDQTNYVTSLYPLDGIENMALAISRSTADKPDNLFLQCSYTLGYRLVESMRKSNLPLDISYFAKGMLAVIRESGNMNDTLPFSVEEMIAIVSDYENKIAAGEVVPSDKASGIYDLVDLNLLPAPIGAEQSFSFCYGYLIMKDAVLGGLNLNITYMIYGVLDYGREDAPLMTEFEMNKCMDDYQKALMKQEEEFQKKIEGNLIEAENFLLENGKKEGVVTTSSGLEYRVLNPGSGEKLEADVTDLDIIYVLMDTEGNVISSSQQGGEEITRMDITRFVPGLREGIPLMNVGATWRFWLHPSLGYGEAGAGVIEPNKLLVFDITVIGVPQE